MNPELQNKLKKLSLLETLHKQSKIFDSELFFVNYMLDKLTKKEKYEERKKTCLQQKENITRLIDKYDEYSKEFNDCIKEYITSMTTLNYSKMKDTLNLNIDTFMVKENQLYGIKENAEERYEEFMTFINFVFLSNKQ
jgi:hypothetical protein